MLFGAAWRQAGIMAAAGLIALRDGPGRLAADHANAGRLAAGIAEILPGAVDPGAVETNIIFVDVAGTGHPAAEWAERLAAHGVLVTMIAGRVRMLTHADVPAAAIGTALDAWRKVAADLAARRRRVDPGLAGRPRRGPAAAGPGTPPRRGEHRVSHARHDHPEAPPPPHVHESDSDALGRAPHPAGVGLGGRQGEGEGGPGVLRARGGKDHGEPAEVLAPRVPGHGVARQSTVSTE